MPKKAPTKKPAKRPTESRFHYRQCILRALRRGPLAVGAAFWGAFDSPRLLSGTLAWLLERGEVGCTGGVWWLRRADATVPCSYAGDPEPHDRRGRDAEAFALRCAGASPVLLDAVHG